MHRYYLSLTRGLIGYYVLFEAPDEDTVRLHASAYFGGLWCSVYNEAYFKCFIAAHYPKTHIINADDPIVLRSWEWE